MKAVIVSIGNSKGIRIPKLMLEESGLRDVVELKAKKGEIKIVPLKKQKAFYPLAAASENSFAKDWNRREEEEAWAVYQSDK